MKEHDDVDVFNEDVDREGGYVYTNPKFRLRHEVGRRISGIIDSIGSLRGKRVLDVGCGDGTSTKTYSAFDPKSVLGLDPARKAVECARKRMAGDSRFSFAVCSANDLTSYYGQFDVAIMRGVLHHLKDPAGAAAEIVKTAPMTIVIEANGMSPIVRLIPILSRTAREHNELVYCPETVKSWFLAAGATLSCCQFRSLVPTFFPEWIGRCCQMIEPMFEALPVVRHLTCGYHIFRADRINP